MLTVLSIAGFDPSGGAGVLTDIKTFAAMGCYGTAAITSITSQNTVAVYGASHQSGEVLRAQIEPVMGDFEIAAVKTGMLPTHETIDVVADVIERYRLSNIVVDPVIRSTSGYDLIGQEAIDKMVERLLPLADVITPNLAEAELLSGMEVKDLDGMKRAALKIGEMCRARASRDGARRAVLVKGGHLADEATDVLNDGREVCVFRSPKLAVGNTHGTGCTLSSAIAALLAQGYSIGEAVTRAKKYLEAALSQTLRIGHGARLIDHFVEGIL